MTVLYLLVVILMLVIVYIWLAAKEAAKEAAEEANQEKDELLKTIKMLTDPKYRTPCNIPVPTSLNEVQGQNREIFELSFISEGGMTASLGWVYTVRFFTFMYNMRPCIIFVHV